MNILHSNSLNIILTLFIKVSFFIVIISLYGCDSILRPDPPRVLSERIDKLPYGHEQYKKDKDEYSKSLKENNLKLANTYRNEMLWQIINDIDYSYYTFKTKFYSHRAGFMSISDLAQLGLSTAATALGGSVIASAAVTALKGGTLSISKNYYREQASEALFIKMDALRETQMARIQKNLLIDSSLYSFEEAYHDALRLFFAGTITEAIQGIASDAGNQKVLAQEDIKNSIDTRVLLTLPKATKETITLRTRLSNEIKNLKLMDDGESIPIVDKILQNSAIIPEGDQINKFNQLQGVVREARTEEEAKNVLKAFQNAGRLKEILNE